MHNITSPGDKLSLHMYRTQICTGQYTQALANRGGGALAGNQKHGWTKALEAISAGKRHRKQFVTTLFIATERTHFASHNNLLPHEAGFCRYTLCLVGVTVYISFQAVPKNSNKSQAANLLSSL